MLDSIETILTAPVAQLFKLNEAFSLYALIGTTLTPLTEWRQHPVELFLFPLCTGTTIGILYGAAEHLLGLQRQGLSLFWVNMVLLAYSMTLLHLRHSHVWIPARGWLGYLIQSPAHHQIHHSANPNHFNKNLGYGLSLWDWAFGTLYIPKKHEALEFGLGAESHEHNGVLKVLWLPFVKAGRQLRRAGWFPTNRPKRTSSLHERDRRDVLVESPALLDAGEPAFEVLELRLRHQAAEAIGHRAD
jgi:hypothetical protein